MLQLGYMPGQHIDVARVGPGRLRKVAIIGTHAATLVGAPWHDPSWEFWSHASAVNVIPKGRVGLVIDVHPPHCFMQEKKNGFTNYYKWLQGCPYPVLMQKKYKDIPQSLAYPYDEIKAEFPNIDIGSQTAYLIAYALSRGVTHIGIWGCEYSHDSE